MIFNSWTFIVFFAVVLALHYSPFSWRTKKLNLVVASYIFYAAWNPPFVVLLWFSTVVDWFSARVIDRSKTRKARRALMVVSLIANLGLLGYFKYGEFLLANFIALLHSVGIEFHPAAPSIILPIGISFYTFHSLSYTIDVYRGQIRPWKSFLDFALYVTFFPALVAGPILRANDFLPQCLEPRRASRQQMGWGLALIVFGLFEKVVIADGFLGPVADAVYTAVDKVRLTDAWLGTLAFSGQIFCDFDGYSHCAIGTAMCLGFAVRDNFRFPYAAIGFSDFWRRWHISLSTWLRDYLYVSLGGNRRGTVRTYINLALTMLIGGLWHGASWRFVVWGGLHGVYLVGERLIRQMVGGDTAQEAGGKANLSSVEIVGTSNSPSTRHQSTAGVMVKDERSSSSSMAWLRPVALALLTYALVCVTWVFFRANSFSDAIGILSAMVTPKTGSGLGLGWYEIGSVSLITVGMLTMHWKLRESSIEEAVSRWPEWQRIAVLAALLLGIALVPGDERAFIYFQF